MMFGIDLNMSPPQDDASEPADQHEEQNSQQQYNNEEPFNNEGTCIVLPPKLLHLHFIFMIYSYYLQ